MMTEKRSQLLFVLLVCLFFYECEGKTISKQLAEDLQVHDDSSNKNENDIALKDEAEKRKRNVLLKSMKDVAKHLKSLQSDYLSNAEDLQSSLSNIRNELKLSKDASTKENKAKDAKSDTKQRREDTLNKIKDIADQLKSLTKEVAANDGLGAETPTKDINTMTKGFSLDEPEKLSKEIQNVNEAVRSVDYFFETVKNKEAVKPKDENSIPEKLKQEDKEDADKLSKEEGAEAKKDKNKATKETLPVSKKLKDNLKKLNKEFPVSKELDEVIKTMDEDFLKEIEMEASSKNDDQEDKNDYNMINKMKAEVPDEELKNQLMEDAKKIKQEIEDMKEMIQKNTAAEDNATEKRLLNAMQDAKSDKSITTSEDASKDLPSEERLDEPLGTNDHQADGPSIKNSILDQLIHAERKLMDVAKRLKETANEIR